MHKNISNFFIITVLLLNVLFDFSVSHHPTHSNDETQATQIISDSGHNDTHETPSQDDHEDCSNGTCHSGYCKLLNLNTINYHSYPFSALSYITLPLLKPEAPYLMGNRRPPKTA